MAMRFERDLESFNNGRMLNAGLACAILFAPSLRGDSLLSTAQVTNLLPLNFNGLTKNIDPTAIEPGRIPNNFDSCGISCINSLGHSIENWFEKSLFNRSQIATEILAGDTTKEKIIQRGSARGDEATILDPMIILGHPPASDDYHTPNAGTATMTDTPLMETPYSVTVVPQQLLKDQQAIRLDKALQNVSGVNIDISNAGLADGMTLRGFESFPFRDRFRFEDQNSNGRRDMANIERIEVLKGPGSILYGQTEPGGIINMVTKKPLKTVYREIEQQIGSFDFYRSTLDTTGPICSGLSYWFNFAYENAGAFRDFVEGERFFIAPVLRWDINPKFQLNLEVDYLHGQNVPDNGIPARDGRPIDVSRERFFGEPFNKAEYDDIVFGLNWSYAINDHWVVKHRFNAEILKSKVINASTPFSDLKFSADGQTVSRTLEILDDARNESYYNVINLTGNFETWGIGHTVLIGADYYREDTRWAYVDSIEFAGLDVSDPVYQRRQPTIDPARDLPGDDIDETEDWYGVFFQDQLELPYGLHVLGGVRYDSIKSSGVEFGKAFNEPRHDALTPRAGLLWRPFPELALYGSYTENFGGSNG